MSDDRRELLKQVIIWVIAEASKVSEQYPDYNSPHEGYAILLEEMDELWEAVRMKQNNPERLIEMRKEAIQVGAVAVRFLMMLETESGRK